MFDFSLRRIVLVAAAALLIPGSAAFATPTEAARAPEIRLAAWARILFTSVEEVMNRVLPGVDLAILMPPPSGVNGEGSGLDPYGKP